MMNCNNSLNEIAREFEKAESVLLFPHMLMDGDALGSCAALCHALRLMGKKAFILVEDDIPGYLSFLNRGYCTYDNTDIASPDICACIDCGDVERFSKRKDKFAEGKVKICIDHHGTSKPFADFNYILPEAAATGEIIFRLLQCMDVELDKEMGEAVFAAITTDTGNYQYSNTTKETHEITAELYDLGIDHNAVSVELYENISLQRMLINNKALDTMRIFAGGKAALAYVTQQMLEDTGAKLDETEGIIQSLRCVSGVEIAVFLKELESATIKIGMRAKTTANVADICEKFGGGGHIKAAGCSMNKPLNEVIEIISREVEKAL